MNDTTQLLPHGPHPRHVITLEEAEHVLRGMWALEPDYFTALLAEARLGRPLNLGAISKARKATRALALLVDADTDTADDLGEAELVAQNGHQP